MSFWRSYIRFWFRPGSETRVGDSTCGESLRFAGVSRSCHNWQFCRARGLRLLTRSVLRLETRLSIVALSHTSPWRLTAGDACLTHRRGNCSTPWRTIIRAASFVNGVRTGRSRAKPLKICDLVLPTTVCYPSRKDVRQSQFQRQDFPDEQAPRSRDSNTQTRPGEL